MLSSSVIAEALQGQVLDGRYHLKTLLGAGGFGVVMRAQHILDGHVLGEIAVKLVPAHADRLGAQVAELRRSLELSHDGLVRAVGIGDGTVHVGGSQDRVIYLAMELGQETLADRLRRQLLGSEEARELAIQIAEVIGYLRERNTLHRDIKPSNILRVGHRWKLADLGIAKTLDDGATVDAPGLGTFFYMPPEALEDLASPSWDVWSLGVTLLEAVTSRLPYPTESKGEWRRLIKNQDPDIPFGLPEPIDRVIRACLQRDRQHRAAPAEIVTLASHSKAVWISEPGVITVDANSGPDALKNAVQSARPWSRIYVGPGVYQGGLRVTQPVEIIGVGAPADVVIDGTDGPALILQADEGLIRGVTLKCSGDAPRARGVVDIVSGRFTLEQCEVESDALDCLFVHGRQTAPVIRRTRFIGGRSVGATFTGDAEGLLESCVFIDNPRSAVVIAGRGNPVLRRTLIKTPAFRAVSCEEGARGYLEACRLEGGNGPAIELFGRAETVFSRCHVAPSRSRVAVRAHSMAKGVFVKCTLDASDDRQWDLSAGHQVQRM